MTTIFDSLRDAFYTAFFKIYPYLEKNATRPRAVIGLFDPSARPHVGRNILSFALPSNRLVVMVHNMDESFLINDTWQRLQPRLVGSA